MTVLVAVGPDLMVDLVNYPQRLCRVCGSSEWYVFPTKRVCRHCERRRQSAYRKRPEVKAYQRLWTRAWRNANRPRLMIRAARLRARKHGWPCDLTPEDIQIPTHCPILGVLLTPEGVNRETSPSLDRIDPKKGYVRGNVRVISARANRLRSDASAAELRALASDAERLDGQC